MGVRAPTVTAPQVTGFEIIAARRNVQRRTNHSVRRETAWAASILLTASLGGSERVWGRPSAPKFFSIFGLQIATFGALWSYFYGSVDCFGRRRSLHDSIMSVSGVIAGSRTCICGQQ